MKAVWTKIKAWFEKSVPARKWLTIVVAVLVACIIIMAGMVYYIDPYMYYSTPKSYVCYDARYCLAGLLKNEKYDTVIVGSSMMQNTNPNDFNGLGWKAVKATCTSACPSDINLLVNYSLKNGTPKRFIIGIDCFTFSYTPDYAKVKMPLYLYDDNIWNDGKYWVDNKVWMSLFPNFLLGKLHGSVQQPLHLGSIDDWAPKFKFGRDIVLDSIKGTDFNAPPQAPSSLEQMKDTYDATVYKIASEHPDVDFYFLYPPYSVLAWYGAANKIKLEDNFEFKEYIIGKKLPNVRTFDFQDISSIIANLDNYKDYTHFCPSINSYMMGCLTTGENEVKTPDEQRVRNERLSEVMSNWSFDK